jgi:predicted ArsR family transcriptional regulator
MSDATPDRLNDVGVLTRREIEARIVGPLVERLAAEFGADRVHAVVRDSIVDIAREQGAALAEHADGNGLTHFAAALGAWSRDGALESEVTALDDDVFAFDVHRCRYAEMYRELGLADLGATLSCNRDAALVEGFNPDIELTRTQTIMQGATHCDFVFRRRT